MNDLKLYISAGIFIALTAIKMLFPSLSDEIRDGITDVLRMEDEQTQAIITLGSELTKEDIIRAFDFTKGLKPKPASAVVTATPTPTASQKAFSSYAVPSNVSYDYSKLPFKYTSPVKGVTSSGFGYREHPIQNEVKYHYGTDFAANTGEKVCAFADGTIYAIGENDSYGKYVIIDHADGYRTLYAHCSKHLKGSGKVKRGEAIALVGETGAATGPHLHFELIKGQTYLNPEFYI